MAVGAAGTDHDRRAGVLLSRWEEDFNGRLGHIGDPDRVVAGPLRLLLLRADVPRVARRDAGPEANRFVGRASPGGEKGR